MPETPQKFFWPLGGPGGRVIRWAAGGPVFLKSAFLVYLVIFLHTWAEIDARSLPKTFLIPRGARGASNWGGGAAGGPVFLKSAFLVFLVIFLQTWAKVDARNLLNFFWSPGGPHRARGDSFLKICILGIFGDISSHLSWYRCQKPPKFFFDPQGGQFS